MSKRKTKKQKIKTQLRKQAGSETTIKWETKEKLLPKAEIKNNDKEFILKGLRKTLVVALLLIVLLTLACWKLR